MEVEVDANPLAKMDPADRRRIEGAARTLTVHGINCSPERLARDLLIRGLYLLIADKIESHAENLARTSESLRANAGLIAESAAL